ncbi:amidohydrolase [Tengunoibacter tsumagoiensis]|uniref:Amidohydrolase n=1 Tax=Tengunoibacter tsumagoiensis TaxID=2014871 RepID=A0A401ZUH8_9CHLR|nr:amidohydrolase [Tengunoibacter tsumagoiensis]GCE10575.1 amidohydrolase [Tengunoibacter tsumagoiensis]
MGTILYLNGNIYTMDTGMPRAQALAIESTGGRILAVGSNDEVRRLGGQYAEIVDLRGRTMVPGFIDAHIHLLETAYRAQRVDASFCVSEEEAAEQVRKRALQTPEGEWIQGGRWDRNLWSNGNFPTRASLDAAAPGHPVALSSKDGHLLWVNSLALQRAGITAETPEPSTGAILRDGNGEPTGVLQEEGATTLIYDVITPPDPTTSRLLLERALSELQRSGITTIHDIEGELPLNIFQQLRDEGRLGVRVQMILPRQLLPQLRERGITNAQNDLLRINGIKIFADGTLGSQTAAMLESFTGSPGNYGILSVPEPEMKETVRSAAELGLTIAIHAIGDRAARVALNSIEYAQNMLAQSAQPDKAPAHLRYRIEHVQLIAPEDLERMRRLGVVASIQPFHAVADRDIAERFWGKRHRRAYAYRTMRQMGIPIALGSDAPVEIFDPLSILYAATVRSDPATQRPSWLPDQALPVSDALWGYTLGAAYAGGEEDHKGSLSVGKLGDAVVLRNDLLTQPQQGIKDNGVQATILGGKIVYGTL